MFDRMGRKANGKREEGENKDRRERGEREIFCIIIPLFKLFIILIVWLFSINDSVLSRAG